MQFFCLGLEMIRDQFLACVVDFFSTTMTKTKIKHGQMKQETLATPPDIYVVKALLFSKFA